MKKIIVLAVALTFAASSAFAVELTPVPAKAAAGAVLDVTNSVANVTGFMKFSKGVYAGAQTTILGYGLTTAHQSGTKYFGTGFDATAIFAQDAGQVVGSTLAAPSSSVTDEAFPSTDWTKL